MTTGVAILGGGIFAREEHLPAIHKAKDLTLKAVYSRSLKSAQSLETDSKDINLYSDDSGAGKALDDLLAREDIGAVIIALPIKNQPQYIRKSLLAGKHVLSEKPVAENVKEAVELIEWYEKEIAPKGITWGVAENARFWAATAKAGDERKKLGGRTLTFRAKVQSLVEARGKYFETEWRKTPTHQGGFLLDGGVHFAAALRVLLAGEPIVSIAAQTAQLQKHLPPVDTIEAAAKTKSGAVGNISISFGTTAEGSEYYVATEKGVVSASPAIAKVDDLEQKEEEERSGVIPEVRAWGEGLAAGKANALQYPREALADLEIIEACLRSGEAGGMPVELKYQQL